MITYRPGRHDAGWLMQSLGPWLEDGTLDDILFAVRGGKEANVYACRGGPGTGGALLAAKVYRPRKHRELSNDAIYREGRGLLDDRGHGVKARDRRIGRAMRRGTRIGKLASHTSWVQHEHQTLQVLHAAGATVPAPIAATANAVLMQFLGDEGGAAPTLDRVRPDAEVAARLFAEVLADIELALSLDRVHGDLSPYNLVWWQDRAWLIDWPQTSSIHHNPHAPRLLKRDVTRVCTARSLGRGTRDPAELADDLWDAVFGTESGVPEPAVALNPPFTFAEPAW